MFHVNFKETVHPVTHEIFFIKTFIMFLAISVAVSSLVLFVYDFMRLVGYRSADSHDGVDSSIAIKSFSSLSRAYRYVGLINYGAKGSVSWHCGYCRKMGKSD